MSTRTYEQELPAPEMLGVRQAASESRVAVMLDPSVIDPLRDVRRLSDALHELSRGPFSLFAPASFYGAAREGALPIETLTRLYGGSPWRPREEGRDISRRYGPELRGPEQRGVMLPSL